MEYTIVFGFINVQHDGCTIFGTWYTEGGVALLVNRYELESNDIKEVVFSVDGF